MLERDCEYSQQVRVKDRNDEKPSGEYSQSRSNITGRVVQNTLCRIVLYA